MLVFATLLSFGVIGAWISGFLGYRARGPMSKPMRNWLVICGVAVLYVVSAQIADALSIFSGTLNVIIQYTAYVAALVVAYWFIAGTSVGRRGTGKRRRMT